MFGFVVLSKANSNEEEQKLYKAHYCGLCHVLKEKYGKKGTLALSYDMVFLELLLSDLYDRPLTKGKEKCSIHPIKEHEYIYTEATDYAADMQMLLYYYSLLDNVHDEGKDKKKADSYRLYAEDLEQKYPRQAEAVKAGLFYLSQLEEEKLKDPMKMSLLFGSLLGEIFVWKDEDFFASELRAIGCAIGRFIYIMDAWTDRKKDLRKKLYNPLRDNTTEKEAEEMLLDAASAATEAFEKLPLDENISLLRNILYSGIWSRFGKKEKKEIEHE